MAQMPRWYRRQVLEHKLSSVLHNPYADISDVQAAKEAINNKLDQQESEYESSQRGLANYYFKKL